ncbi:MAG TPA: UDP-N-acetylmuramoyl-L-alanine--D-glutamate ligase [Sedimentisphaerales bacterium]|nr:UDP-N-acetylmuramoyl-L-alanine--D-glutamate ligase [Sedimentisphaerales bacterium]
MNRDFFTDKKVLIMGLGRFGGGVDVAEFAVRAGAKVIVTDLAPAAQLSDSIGKLEEFPEIEFHLGSHDPADFKQADIIIANPAVPGDNEFLQLARRNNKFVTFQINIFFELCPAQIIGITGANGKSTTAALTTHLLKNASDQRRATGDESVIASAAKQSQTTQYAIRNTQYEHVWLSGNIGNQPLLTILDKIKVDDLVVLEFSSFQLEQLAEIHKAPKIALLTNLTPNHLDRHGTFANYCAAKENIFKFQVRRVGFSPPNKSWWGKPHPTKNSPAVSIFNAEDKIAAQWFEKYSRDTGRICIKFSISDVSKEIRDSFTLPGRANLSNLAAAIAIAKYFGIDDDRIKNSLPDFKPLPHRLELVEEINGVSWYNDSIATTPQSAIAALEAFDQPKIIIAGGYDKNLPFEELGRKIAASAKAAILFGQTAPKIADAIQLFPEAGTRVQIVDSLTEAVQIANRLAETGDVVLLSPACASYDMFDNFQHRGQEFIRHVRALSN